MNELILTAKGTDICKIEYAEIRKFQTHPT